MLCPIGNFFYYFISGQPVERELGVPKGFGLEFGWISSDQSN
jgi:hypothetical protein